VEALRADPSVASVEPNRYNFRQLGQSLPLINQPLAAAQGFKGAGCAVAVLDTGVFASRACAALSLAQGRLNAVAGGLLRFKLTAHTRD
jgi:hypothetical protein